HTIVANLAAFFSMMLGTVFTSVMGEKILSVFGFPFSSTQILLFVCAALQCVLAVICVLTAKALTPPEIYSGLKVSKRKRT
ncbi:MAG: hypothetical protein IKW18_07300, partial [Clostridia bacterium]|nr:hypothetical protein [Clostridia bacterium]